MISATSPYAPLRRQSSSSSNSVNYHVLRRTSSASAISSGALLWIVHQCWRRLVPSNVDGKSGGIISARESLHSISNFISSNLILDSAEESFQSLSRKTNDELSIRQYLHRRKKSAILQWIVDLFGGNYSKMGKLIILIVGMSRELLLRTVDVIAVALTGVPASESLVANGYENNQVKAMGNAEIDLVSHTHIKYNQQDCSNIDINLIRKDRVQIDQVLRYWFGQASPDVAQKSLWMIASSSETLRHQVDLEISDNFRSLIVDLSSSLAIETISVKRTLDHQSLDANKLNRWTDDGLFGWEGKVAAIIALDQMSRHIHRYDKTMLTRPHPSCDHMTQCAIPEQHQLDKLALNVAVEFQRKHKKELSTGMIPLPMRIFSIMPLRHASNIQNLGIVQADVESAAALHDECDKMIRRFRKATNRRMAALQDEARRLGKLSVGADTQIVMIENMPVNHKSWEQFDDEQILECFPFTADMSQASTHVVTKTIRDYLIKMNVLQSTDSQFTISTRTEKSNGEKNHDIYRPSIGFVPTVIVSLSGGVDSMVIASVLAFLRDSKASRLHSKPEDILHITAIHVDYANRLESGAEAAYIERFCHQIGAKFICRRISEVTRGVTSRDEYEKIAREIRFSLYRQCCDEVKRNSGMMNNAIIGVMLGHHRGDLRENVISNAHKGCGPLDLSGMISVSKNEGVTLLRPLLPLEKSDIFDYAHTFGVPYFKDTTPHWSTRGKLRNRLLPLLEEIYGEGSLNNLSSLAEESDNARTLMLEKVAGPFMDRVEYHSMGICFETAPWKDYGIFFWKFVLRVVLHRVGRGMFSDKSVESFLERIRAAVIKEGWLQCRKDYAVYLEGSGIVLIFHPISFPFQEENKYIIPNCSVRFGQENRIEIGPWYVSADVVTVDTEETAEEMLRKKAFYSMNELMSGEINYYVKCPIICKTLLPSKLVAVKGFTKRTRPTSWKGLDLKVEQTLPLLGLDNNLETKCDRSEYGKAWALVRVQLKLNITDTL